MTEAQDGGRNDSESVVPVQLSECDNSVKSEDMCFCRKNVFNCQITGEEPLILRSGPSVKKVVITMGAQTTAGKVSEDRVHHETLGGMLLRR